MWFRLNNSEMKQETINKTVNTIIGFLIGGITVCVAAIITLAINFIL